jgi:hypothetical protein
MLTIAQKLFDKTKVNQRSGVASTHRFLSLQSMVPFILPSTVSLTQNTRCGRGMIVPVIAAANVSTVVTHNLGRIAQFAFPLMNIGAFTPAYQFDTGHGTTKGRNAQSVIFSVGCNPCLVLFF